MNTKQTFMYSLIALVIIAFTALSLTGCPPEPDPGSGLSTLSGTITISPSSNVTVGMELTATYTGTETVIYQWKQGAANVGTNSNKYTPTAAGSYTVTVSATGYHSKTSNPIIVTVTDPNSAATFTSITAVYNSSNPIFPDTTLHTLKDGLTVTAHYSDSTTKTLELEDYTLNGTLAEGSSVITVSYTESGITKTTTFTVTVNAAHTHIWSNWSQTTAPTCTEPGADTRNCTANPPHSETQTGTAALGHDSGTWHTTLEPDCTTAGSKELRCTRDNAVLNTEAIAINPNVHNYQSISTATETEDGEEGMICINDHSHKQGTTTIAYATGTAGLAFDLIFNYSTNVYDSYNVSRGTATGTIHIPAYHRPNADSQYLPVTAISNGIDSASDTAFGGTYSSPNTTVTSITFAENSQFKTIGNYAFYYCTSLTSVTIPDSVRYIGGEAFSYTKLTTITIPASVTTISYLRNCTSLASITVDANNPNYSSEGGILYNKDKTTLVAYPSATGSITIPANIMIISDGAFGGCTNLTSVTFAENSQLNYIGENVFNGCTNLTSIIIPAGVTTIRNQTFILCSSLTSVTFAEGSQLQIFGNSAAFSGCTSLNSITLPEGLTTIGNSTFNACISLNSITIPANVTIVGSWVFYQWRNTQTINVPFANADAKPPGWDTNWNNGNAVVKYLQSDGTYQ